MSAPAATTARRAAPKTEAARKVVRPRLVYRVESLPGRDEAKGEAMLASFLRRFYAAPPPPKPKSRRAQLAAFKAGFTKCQGCLYEPDAATRSRALHVHHVTPTERGGADDPDNLLVLCARCHALAHSILQWRRKAKPDRERLLRRLWVLESKRQSTP